MGEEVKRADSALVSEALSEAVAEMSTGGIPFILACVEAAIIAGDGVTLPDGVAESLASVRAALEPAEGEVETPDDPAEAAAEGERAYQRRADGTYCRADAGTMQDDGTVVLCTDGEARDGHILDVATLQTGNYAENPVLFYNHSHYGDSLPIGRIIPESIADGMINQRKCKVGRPEFHRETEQSAQVANLWEKRYLKCVSATWRPSPKPEDTIPRRQLPIDHPAYKADGWGYWFKNAEMVEMSVVGIPSDTEAKRVRGGGVVIDDEMIERVTAAVVERLTPKADDKTWW